MSQRRIASLNNVADYQARSQGIVMTSRDQAAENKRLNDEAAAAKDRAEAEREAATAASAKAVTDQLARIAYVGDFIDLLHKQKGLSGWTLHTAHTFQNMVALGDQFAHENAPRLMTPFLAKELGMGFAPLPAPQSGDDAKQAEGGK